MRRFQLAVFFSAFAAMTGMSAGQQVPDSLKSEFCSAFEIRLNEATARSEAAAMGKLTSQKAARENLLMLQTQAKAEREALISRRAALNEAQAYALREPRVTQWYNNLFRQLNVRDAQNQNILQRLARELGNADRTLNESNDAYLKLILENARGTAIWKYVYASWNKNKSNDNWAEVMARLRGAVNALALSSTVTVNTPPGTTAYYQQSDGGPPQRMAGGSALLGLGIYYFWLERPGQSPSQKRPFAIVNSRYAWNLTP